MSRSSSHPRAVRRMASHGFTYVATCPAWWATGPAGLMEEVLGELEAFLAVLAWPRRSLAASSGRVTAAQRRAAGLNGLAGKAWTAARLKDPVFRALRTSATALARSVRVPLLRRWLGSPGMA